MAQQTYTRNFKIAVENGACVKLPAPPRGEINRIVVAEDTATITDATLYDRQDACDGIERSTNPDDENPSGLLPAVHQITPVLTPSGGVILELEKSWAYQNQDEQSIHGRDEFAIWMSLTLSGGGIIHIGYTIIDRSPQS